MPLTGTKIVALPLIDVQDRLKQVMAGAGCEVTESQEGMLCFRHGTFLTQTATQIPKVGRFILTSSKEGTQIDYQIEVVKAMRIWLTAFAILTCWAIFPPILIYRILSYHPNRFVENLLGAF